VPNILINSGRVMSKPDTSYWRERAEEYRRLAEESFHPATAKRLRALSVLYSASMDDVENAE
jgi:hypothetical protein